VTSRGGASTTLNEHYLNEHQGVLRNLARSSRERCEVEVDGAWKWRLEIFFRENSSAASWGKRQKTVAFLFRRHIMIRR
jgi:hypothetical protein